MGTEGSIVSELAAFVRGARLREGLTQAELAHLARVGRRFVSDLEGGTKSTLRLDKVAAVLAVFGRRLAIVDVREADGGG